MLRQASAQFFPEYLGVSVSALLPLTNSCSRNWVMSRNGDASLDGPTKPWPDAVRGCVVCLSGWSKRWERKTISLKTYAKSINKGALLPRSRLEFFLKMPHRPDTQKPVNRTCWLSPCEGVPKNPDNYDGPATILGGSFFYGNYRLRVEGWWNHKNGDSTCPG